jgi:hypothetical protein
VPTTHHHPPPPLATCAVEPDQALTRDECSGAGRGAGHHHFAGDLGAVDHQEDLPAPPRHPGQDAQHQQVQGHLPIHPGQAHRGTPPPATHPRVSSCTTSDV